MEFIGDAANKKSSFLIVLKLVIKISTNNTNESAVHSEVNKREQTFNSIKRKI